MLIKICKFFVHIFGDGTLLWCQYSASKTYVFPGSVMLAFGTQPSDCNPDSRRCNILWSEKTDNLNIKTKMFNFEVRVLIGWQANTLN